MSNTSSVTPYEASAPSQAERVGAAVADWLAQTSAAEQAAVQRVRDERRRELLSPRSHRSQTVVAPMTLVGLRLNQPDTLLKTAETLGYRVQRTAVPASDRPVFLLERSDGQRLALAQNQEGRLTLLARGDRKPLETLVRQHTLDRTVEHFRRNGMQIELVHRGGSESEVRAKEVDSGRQGGAAEVKVLVRSSGTAEVEVDRLKGPRCVEIVNDYARAVGAAVSECTPKDAFYQLPGEPARTDVKV